MKKLKVVLSDLHLGKGQFLPQGSLNTLEEFFYDQKFSEFLDYYSTGENLHADVELVINGDFLNILQTDYKGHFTTVNTESIDLVKVKSIIDGHPVVFEALRRFVSRPQKRITYVVGNHDQGMLWQKTRELLDETVGARINFKNIVYFFDGIHIEHGHQHEAANRIDPKKFFIKQDLPEPVLNLPWASYFFVEYILKLKQKIPHVDKVRPFSALIRWGIINETFFTIKAIYGLIKHFLTSHLKRRKNRTFTFKQILSIFQGGAVFPDLEDAAQKIMKDERVHTVIFGHTHVYMYRQWGQDKEYLNTGTWTEVTGLDISSLGKITKLTYALVEYPALGGRARARLKEWRGHYRVEQDVAI